MTNKTEVELQKIRGQIYELTGKEISSISYADGDEIIALNNVRGSIDLSQGIFVLQYKDGTKDEVINISSNLNIDSLSFDYVDKKQNFIALFLSPMFWIGVIALIILTGYSEYLSMLVGYILAVTLSKSDKVYKKYGIERFQIK